MANEILPLYGILQQSPIRNETPVLILDAQQNDREGQNSSSGELTTQTNDWHLTKRVCCTDVRREAKRSQKEKALEREREQIDDARAR